MARSNQSAAVAIQDAGREIALVGVDADVFETDPSIGSLLLTSILKGIDVGTKDAIVAAGEGNFDVTRSSARSRTTVWASPRTTTGPTACRPTSPRRSTP